MQKVFLTALFFASLEAAYFFQQTNFWFISAAVALAAILLSWKLFRKPELSVVVALHILSSLLFLHFLHSFSFSQAAIFILSGFFYLIFERNMLVPAVSLFVFLLPILHWQFEFNFSVLFALVLIFLFSFFLFFSSFSLLLETVRLLKSRLLYFSLVAALVLTELYFVLSNLPFNIVSMDFLLAVVYYLFLDLIILYFSRKLTKAVFAKNIFFAAVSFIFIFFSVKWFPD